MKSSLLLILALILTASCGKKKVEKTFPFDDFSEAIEVDDIERFMPEIRTVFSQQLITDHFTDDADLIFVDVFITPGKDSFRGKSFSSLQEATNCSHFLIRPNSQVLLTITTNENTCLRPAIVTTVPYNGNYNYQLNPFLKEALNLTPENIVVREVTYEGEVYAGYGIQKNSGFQLSTDYKEYVVVPDFPLVLNPVMIYDSQTGEVRALKGIEVR